jgi:hypothetical protein
MRVWSVGPLTKTEAVMGLVLRAGGATVTAPHVSSQTGSIFVATRSVVFAGDRIVLASMVGMRKVEGAQVPESVFQILSLDAGTGEIKNIREATASASLFATNDGHVIVSGRSLLRLTPDLKDDGSLTFTRQVTSSETWKMCRRMAPRWETRQARGSNWWTLEL